VTCASLKDWHEQHAGDPYRLCVLEADVVFMNPNPTSIGNYLMVVEDESIMDLSAEGVTVWIHKDLWPYIDFGPGSRVFIVGRTVTMPSWDPVSRTVDRSKTRVGINAFAVYAVPELKVPLEEAQVIESGAEEVL